MRLFAISDLHLSFGVDKPMDVFGDHWSGHADKIRESWDARITDQDWVLVGGDTSWGLNMAQAQPDLDWLGERPGQKILIRGNHCTWWSTLSKVRKALDASVRPLHCNAFKMDDGTVVVGARLWDPPNAPWADENAKKIFNREIERFRLSIEAGKKLDGDRMIALVHYPPRYSDGRCTAAVELMEEASVEACIYGHLHGRKYHKQGFQGEAGGIRYYLTACDAIDFEPIEIPLGSGVAEA
ncbi:MAG: metallophosphoesterase [Planctomycetota bacterium]